MSILVNKETRLLVQGITGRAGLFHTAQMMAYGTKVVAGVTPGKGGEWAAGVPVFDTVRAAVESTGANCSVIYVPARSALDAMFEAAEAGLPLIVCITEGLPVADTLQACSYLAHRGVCLIGPNSPGVITPGEVNVGVIPGHIASPGNVGVMARSGTLMYEVINTLTRRGLGQSTCVGIGSDPVGGINFLETLKMFNADPLTEKIVLIGEIGGAAEEKAAEYIAANMTKLVVALVAGQTAPPGKRLGHAGAIIENGAGLAADKIKALEAAGVRVATHLEQIPELLT